MEQLLTELAKSGPFGVITALSLWYAWTKDKQLRKLYEDSLTRTEALNERYHTTLAETSKTIQALTQFEADGDRP